MPTPGRRVSGSRSHRSAGLAGPVAFAFLLLLLSSGAVPGPARPAGPARGALERPSDCTSPFCPWLDCPSLGGPPSSVTASVSDSYVVPYDPVQFAGNVSGATTPYRYEWAFGDGTFATGSAPSHTYDLPGSYLAVVWAQSECALGAPANTTVQVEATGGGLEVVANASGQEFARTPANVSFLASSSGGGPVQYAWQFGDGQTGQGAEVRHEFTRPGDYAVRVDATNGTGVVAEFFQTVVVGPTGIQASGNATPARGLVPMGVALSVTAYGWYPPFQYVWSFGDNSSLLPSTSPSESHTYHAAGAFAPEVLVMDSGGAWSIAELPGVSAIPRPPLLASLSAAPTSGPAPLTVGFGANASGGTSPYSYSWSFGDGQGGYAANGSHTFVHPGNYTVRLVVTDSAGHQVAREVNVTVASPAPPASLTLPDLEGVILVGVLLALVGALAVTLVVRRRRRRRSRSAAAPPARR
jgi:PKD repeat protein